MTRRWPTRTTAPVGAAPAAPPRGSGADPTAPKGRAAITHRRSQDGSKTDWQAAWRSLVAEAQLALSADSYTIDSLARALLAISDENRSIATYTHPVTGNRPFVTPKTWKAA